MTRNGKLARLPLEIRDELNRRLDDGEQGVALVAWLNQLPAVNEILNKQFEGRPINEVNLTDWKAGGYADWQARQTAESIVERWGAENPMSDEVAEALTERLTVHYAAALEDAIAETDDKPRNRVERLGKSLRDVVRLRRFELTNDVERERVKMGRERLVLQRAKLKQSGGQWENDEEERLSHLEKAEIVKQMLEDA